MTNRKTNWINRSMDKASCNKFTEVTDWLTIDYCHTSIFSILEGRNQLHGTRRRRWMYLLLRMSRQQMADTKGFNHWGMLMSDATEKKARDHQVWRPFEYFQLWFWLVGSTDHFHRKIGYIKGMNRFMNNEEEMEA